VFEPAERAENGPVGSKKVKYFKPRRNTDHTGDKQVVIPGYAAQQSPLPAASSTGSLARTTGPFCASIWPKMSRPILLATVFC
jgi:hypothetical protein